MQSPTSAFGRGCVKTPKFFLANEKFPTLKNGMAKTFASFPQDCRNYGFSLLIVPPKHRVRRSSRIRHGTSKSPGVLGPARSACGARDRPAAERRHSDSTPREARLSRALRQRFAFPGSSLGREFLHSLGRKRTLRQSPKKVSASRGISFLWLKFPGIWFNLKCAPVELVDGISSFFLPAPRAMRFPVR